MDVAEAIRDITTAKGLPRDALRRASEARAELAPRFVAMIKAWLAGEESDRDRDWTDAMFYAFHLLGEWREEAAYRPIARLLHANEAELDAIFGDALIETSHRVVVAVFDGDPRPIFDIITDADADEFVRSRMCEALAMLVVAGRLDREPVDAFLRDRFADPAAEDGNYVWHGWQSTIAMLGATELVPLVKQAFERESIDPRWLAFKYFERDLERAVRDPKNPWPDNDGKFTPWGDSAEELSTWYGFSEAYERDQQRDRDQQADPARLLDGPYVNPYRSVGRNDPCPCGSGKKFKTCCMP